MEQIIDAILNYFPIVLMALNIMVLIIVSNNIEEGAE